jgi:hypothetical protein
MFDQLDHSNALGKKTLKEKIAEGLMIIIALVGMLGIIIISFYWG